MHFLSTWKVISKPDLRTFSSSIMKQLNSLLLLPLLLFIMVNLQNSVVIATEDTCPDQCVDTCARCVASGASCTAGQKSCGTKTNIPGYCPPEPICVAENCECKNQKYTQILYTFCMKPQVSSFLIHYTYILQVLKKLVMEKIAP